MGTLTTRTVVSRDRMNKYYCKLLSCGLAAKPPVNSVAHNHNTVIQRSDEYDTYIMMYAGLNVDSPHHRHVNVAFKIQNIKPESLLNAIHRSIRSQLHSQDTGQR